MHAGTNSGLKRNTEGGGSPEHSIPRTSSLAAALEDSQMADPQPVPSLPTFFAGGLSGAAAASDPAAVGPRMQMVDLHTLEQLLDRQDQRHRSELSELLRAFHQVPPTVFTPGVAVPASASPAPSVLDPRKEHLRKSKIVSNKIVAEAAKLKKLLHKVSLTKDFCEKLQDQITTLASGKVPPQLRVFRLPFESEIWSDLVGETDLSMMIIPVKKTDTYEEAAQRLHIEYLASHSVLMLTVQQNKLLKLKEEASLEIFIQTVLAEAALEMSTIQKTVEGITSHSVAASSDLELEVRKACEVSYGNQVRAIASEKLVADRKKEQQREREQKALERAALLPRDEIIRRGLSEILRGKGPRGKNKNYDENLENKVIDFKKLLNIDVDVVSDAARRDPSESLPKNGASPGGGRGQNSNQKGKGQAKAKAKAKAKAAPNGQGKAAGKGSSKAGSLPVADGKNKAKPKPKAGGKGQSKGQQPGGKGKGKGKGGKI